MPSFPRRREPRIPAPAGVYGRHPCSLRGCRGGSRIARRPRHPKRTPQPNDNCPLRHSRDSPYIGCMRHSHAEHPSFPRRREPRIPAALVWMSDPLALWERVRVRVPPVNGRQSQHPANRRQVCPLRHRRPSPYIGCMRPCVMQVPSPSGTGRVARRSREGMRNPLSPWEKARMRVRTTGNATECNQMQLN